MRIVVAASRNGQRGSPSIAGGSTQVFEKADRVEPGVRKGKS